jgi:hypothetical protein
LGGREGRSNFILTGFLTGPFQPLPPALEHPDDFKIETLLFKTNPHKTNLPLHRCRINSVSSCAEK